MITFKEYLEEGKTRFGKFSDETAALNFAENFEENIESILATVVSEAFTAKTHPQIHWTIEPGYIDAYFDYNGTDVNVTFAEISPGKYEVNFSTKDKHGIFSTTLKNVSNNSLGLFNYLIGTIIDFGTRHPVKSFYITEPSHDFGKRLQFYKKILESPTMKNILASHGYSVFGLKSVGAPIELYKR